MGEVIYLPITRGARARQRLALLRTQYGPRLRPELNAAIESYWIEATKLESVAALEAAVLQIERVIKESLR